LSRGFFLKALTLEFFYDGGVISPFSISLLTIIVYQKFWENASCKIAQNSVVKNGQVAQKTQSGAFSVENAPPKRK